MGYCELHVIPLKTDMIFNVYKFNFIVLKMTAL